MKVLPRHRDITDPSCETYDISKFCKNCILQKEEPAFQNFGAAKIMTKYGSMEYHGHPSLQGVKNCLVKFPQDAVLNFGKGEIKRSSNGLSYHGDRLNDGVRNAIFQYPDVSKANIGNFKYRYLHY